MNKLIIIFALVFISPQLVASSVAAVPDKPPISSSLTVNLTSQVIALDYESRELTLKNPQGEVNKITVSPEEKNLEKVKVGDSINMQIIDSVEIKVVSARNAEPGSAASKVVYRNNDGQPGMESTDTRVINAVVEAINLENNTFKLRGENDVVQEYTARNPDNLKKAAVGDLVIITYTTSIVVSLAVSGVK
jgi:hypothetical protein